LERSRIARMSPLGNPPADPTNAVADDPRAAQLGRRLFFDGRLAGDGMTSCAHCHDPDQAFSDGRTLAEGVGTANRNAPGLMNIAWQRWLFWDGRADTLWAQALQPVENPVEMGGDRVAVARLMARDATLRTEYEALFGALPSMDSWPDHARPSAIDDEWAQAWQAMPAPDRDSANRVFANTGKALAAFERRLVGGESAFDQFARGLAADDPTAMAALNPLAQRGLKLFLGKAGCRDCHNGPALSDGEFHDLQLRPLSGGDRTDPARLAAIARVLEDPFNAQGAYSDAREGQAIEHLRFLRKNPELWGAFRTPSLRNVARTPPYMEQGQLADLDAVLRFYSTREGAAPAGHHQETVLQPLNLSAMEIAELKAFLLSLDEQQVSEEWRSPPP
jgi:cytochrome c peroxidase